MSYFEVIFEELILKPLMPHFGEEINYLWENVCDKGPRLSGQL
jgi:hypothetical protein